MKPHFKPDTRLVKSADSTLLGFQRGRQVIWLPYVLANLLWNEGPDTLGSDIVQELNRLGLIEMEVCDRTADGSISRTWVFTEALCEDAASATIALKNAVFVILGCGGLGSNLAITLASLGATQFILIDGDVIEESNLNRLLWASVDDIGTSKVKALAAHLQTRYSAHSIAVNEFNEETILKHVLNRYQPQNACFILTLDNSAVSRRLAHFLHCGSHFPYVQAGYVDRYCVAGPLVTNSKDPCPFCGSPPVNFVNNNAFIAPSAAPNNLITASFVACQLVRILGSSSSVLNQHRWTIDLATGATELQNLKKHSSCEVCTCIL